MKKFPLLCALFIAFYTLTGCNSYTIAQRNLFSDENGNVVEIEYGHAEKDHHSKFIAPRTGKELDYRTRLLVKVHLPDGDSFKAWQCMNIYNTAGTMYKTDNEEWVVLVTGFTVEIFHITDDKRDHLLVYQGFLSSTPKNDDKDKDSKWRKMKKDANGKWH